MKYSRKAPPTRVAATVHRSNTSRPTSMTNRSTIPPVGTRERRTFAEVVRIGKTDHIPHDVLAKTTKPILALHPYIEINNKMRKFHWLGRLSL